MTELVSPNQLLAEARELYLDGREPVSKGDRTTVLCHVAERVEPSCRGAALKIFCALYGWTDFSSDDTDFVAYMVSLVDAAETARWN